MQVIERNTLRIMKYNELRVLSQQELDYFLSQVFYEKDNRGNIDIYPFPFCPVCGSTKETIYGHEVPFPEVWTEVHCFRCHFKVGGADNSPYYHILYDYIEQPDYFWGAVNKHKMECKRNK